MQQHTWYTRVTMPAGQLSRCLLWAFCLLIAGTATLSKAGFAADEISPALERVFGGNAPKTVAELKAMQSHVQQLAKKAVSATVAIRVGPAHGSGVIVSPDGYVLTAAHVAGRPGRRATVIMSDGRVLSGRSLGLHFKLDAGLIKISSDGTWPSLEMADSSELSIGQWCAGTGHPGGWEANRTPVFRLGRVLARGDGMLIKTDCQLIGGDSGGPLVDMFGKVIGVHSRIGSNLANNQHVPISAYLDHWDQLVSGKELGLGQPWMGVKGRDSAAITRVTAGSPAEQAGIEVGDVVILFDDKEVGSMAELRGLVQTKRPGDKVHVTIQRGEKRLGIDMILGQRGL